MNSHKHAALTPRGRALLVYRVLHEGCKVRDASSAAGVSERTGYKWLARFKAEGHAGLSDRSSRPWRSPSACDPEQLHRFEQRRRERVPLWRIARECGRSLATVARHMARMGLSRLEALQQPVPVIRYERAAPGELLHIDTKRLGRIQGIGHRITGDRTTRNRGIGWDAVHLAIDDHSRVSFAAIKPDETAASCVQFLREAVAWYAGMGVKIERVMTDNGTGYKNAFKAACDELGYATSTPGPTPHRPMARPSASCRPACASGLTPVPTKAQRSGRPPCSPSLTTTTGSGHTPLSTASLP